MNEAGQLYVYYRLRPEDVSAARAAFEAARGDADVRLAERSEPPLTWMEVYSSGARAAESRIAAAMSPYAQGGRHQEIFSALT